MQEDFMASTRAQPGSPNVKLRRGRIVCGSFLFPESGGSERIWSLINTAASCFRAVVWLFHAACLWHLGP